MEIDERGTSKILQGMKWMFLAFVYLGKHSKEMECLLFEFFIPSILELDLSF